MTDEQDSLLRRRLAALAAAWVSIRVRRPGAAVVLLCRRRVDVCPVPFERSLQSFFNREARRVAQVRDGRGGIRHRMPHVARARRRHIWRAGLTPSIFCSNPQMKFKREPAAVAGVVHLARHASEPARLS